MRTLSRFLIVALSLSVISCSEDENASSIDITNIELSSRSANCEDYANSYTASAMDISRSLNFTASLVISSATDSCSFVSNGIPNHDFNDSGAFANNVAEVSQTFSVTKSPVSASSTTALSLSTDNAVFLNGAKLDLLPAACYGVGSEPLGQEKIGCNALNYAWRYDPMFSGNNFGTDSHNAHTQPDGAYHYHGNPKALFDETSPTVESPVIGFAADGYPIFGSYINDNGTIREVQPSYRLRAGARDINDLPGGLVEGADPGGNYDGTFRDDYEYVSSLGDLDECNGMTKDGVYGYYITNSFPWVMNCYKGTPNSSFDK